MNLLICLSQGGRVWIPSSLGSRTPSVTPGIFVGIAAFLLGELPRLDLAHQSQQFQTWQAGARPSLQLPRVGWGTPFSPRDPPEPEC